MKTKLLTTTPPKDALIVEVDPNHHTGVQVEGPQGTVVFYFTEEITVDIKPASSVLSVNRTPKKAKAKKKARPGPLIDGGGVKVRGADLKKLREDAGYISCYALERAMKKAIKARKHPHPQSINSGTLQKLEEEKTRWVTLALRRATSRWLNVILDPDIYIHRGVYMNKKGA